MVRKQPEWYLTAIVKQICVCMNVAVYLTWKQILGMFFFLYSDAVFYAAGQEEKILQLQSFILT